MDSLARRRETAALVGKEAGSQSVRWQSSGGVAVRMRENDTNGWGPRCWANQNGVSTEDFGAPTNLGFIVGALLELDFLPKAPYFF